MKINDTLLKKRIGLGETPAQNKKFYDWKKRDHLKELIDLAKKGLLYESIVAPEMREKLENEFIKF